MELTLLSYVRLELLNVAQLSRDLLGFYTTVESPHPDTV
jgi:hypothetical protein